MNKKKIGIFGGSFNPIHNWHVKLIEETLAKKLVDEVWIIPCKEHVFDKKLINADKRLRMIEYAIEGIENVRINDIEIKTNGKSYTLNTLRELKKKYPHEFYLIVGSDILSELDKWHRIEELKTEVNFLVFPRKDYPIKEKLGDNFYVVDIFPEILSSTEIRNKIQQGESILELVPAKVYDYIRREDLYNGI